MAQSHFALDAPANETLMPRMTDLAASAESVIYSPRISVIPTPPRPADAEAHKTRNFEEENSVLRREVEHWRGKAANLDKHVFEMRSLLQSGKGFSENLNIESLLIAFMAVCRERYGAVNSAVMLLDDLDPDNVFYRVRAYHGLPSTFTDPWSNTEELLLFRIPHNQGLLWQVIHQGDVFSVRDMQKAPRFKTAFEHWNLNVLKSDVWVPLMRGGEVLGILTLGESEDGNQIPESEYAFLQEIGAVAATNIDSTLKYEKNERILNNLRTLYDVNQQLANVNDFKALTIETLSTAVNALRAQKANLMLYNPETERLEIKVVWGNIPKAVRDNINDGKMETRSFAIGEGVAGKAAQLRHPVRINDRARIDQVGRNVAYCILSVPLLYGGQLMGAMTLTNKVKEETGRLELDPLGRFGADDEQLLLGLADQAAMNLHKARLYNASITDRMTGLYNARHFESTFEENLVRCRELGTPLTLAVTDIDHFKKFNDAYGHKAGDAVLVRTASLLQDTVRQSFFDGAFRYGGEEFCMLLPDTDAKTASHILEDYRKRVEEMELSYEGKLLKVTVSVGLAQTEEGIYSRKLLFESADKALYQSKGGGRNRVTLAMNGGFQPYKPEDR